MTHLLPNERRRACLSAVAIALLLGGASPLVAQYGATGGQWRHYGGDAGSTKYSPLDQITASNFSTLRIVWRWESADRRLVRTDATGIWRAPFKDVLDQLEREDAKRWAGWAGTSGRPTISGFIATPLMVDGVLYVSTALTQAAAIDARTGKTLWVYDPRAYESGTPPNSPWRSRGVAYWAGEGGARILWGTTDGYLMAVDAKTGRAIPGFGNQGRVDLTEGLPRASRDHWRGTGRVPLSSPAAPLVVRDTVIIGTSLHDFYPAGPSARTETTAMLPTKEAPPGWVRAYDVKTGREKWHFNPIPQPGEFGNDTWLRDSWAYTGNANVSWAGMSADEALGYVYLPLGSPNSDHYGGHRPGAGLFGDSLVCVDVETGKRVWHFQMIHHNMWDYDNVAAPNLVDINVAGRRIKAVVQINKPGFVYTFDRVTGQPVWPIEEHAVPTESDLEGERPWPTQPFPTKPPPVEPQGSSIDDLVDFTPELRQKALEAVKDFKLGPIYTPHSLRGTIMRPGVIGALNWGGAAVDPETGTLYVPSRSAPDMSGSTVIRFRQSNGGEESTVRYIHSMTLSPQLSYGLPLWKPPYSRLTAIDMNKGEHAWMIPTGKGDKIRKHALLKDLNLPPLGGDMGHGSGPLLTKTLLVLAMMAGGTNDGPRLVAYDKTTGQEVGSVDLPAAPFGTPMTYVLDGKQYIALTVGGTVPPLIAAEILDRPGIPAPQPVSGSIPALITFRLP